MKKFLFNIALFCMVGLLTGELVTRHLHLTSDIPRRMIDDDGIQKYIPHQSGFWKGGGHQWHINRSGWTGALPDSNDNLVILIGDSFVENLMNPDDCHQNVILERLLAGYNFMEAARSGVSFVEAMEIANQLDSLHPDCHVIYVHDSDFLESIASIEKRPTVTQVNLRTEDVTPGKMELAYLKRMLYSSKFLYYLFNRWSSNRQITKTRLIDLPRPGLSDEELDLCSTLLDFTVKHYAVENRVLAFRPGSDKQLVEIARRRGYAAVLLDAEGDDSWTFEHDSHWTCFGHEQAAEQIAEFLEIRLMGS